MAALKASGEAPSVLRVRREVFTTLFMVSGVSPTLSSIPRIFRVITELSIPKGQKVAHRRQPVQEYESCTHFSKSAVLKSFAPTRLPNILPLVVLCLL